MGSREGDRNHGPRDSSRSPADFGAFGVAGFTCVDRFGSVVAWNGVVVLCDNDFLSREPPPRFDSMWYMSSRLRFYTRPTPSNPSAAVPHQKCHPTSAYQPISLATSS